MKTVLLPMVRFILESKFEADYDFSKPIGELTINDGFIPTIRTSSGGPIRPASWEEFEGKSILHIRPYSHVYYVRGTYKGITDETTVQQLLELSGVNLKMASRTQWMQLTDTTHRGDGTVITKA